MASTMTHERHSQDLFLDRALAQIRHDRKRNTWLAVGGTIIALFLLGSGVYLAYNDVPAPERPANVTP
ncbi:MAG: hypothetical protein QM784_19695 [Polyangiaceae bacterium]